MESLRDDVRKRLEEREYNNIIENVKQLRKFSKSLRNLIEDPQCPFPDVLLWMIVDGKRAAYARLPSRFIIDFQGKNNDPESSFHPAGKDCGKIQTLFMKKPGQVKGNKSGWTTPCAIRVFFWLGLWDERSKRLKFINKLPKGFDENDFQKTSPIPSKRLLYTEEYCFNLRGYIYQARHLIPSDESGLSDPYVRIIFGNQNKQSSIQKEALSPIWDETLSIENLKIYGNLQDTITSPPEVIVEIYDYDSEVWLTVELFS